MTSGMHGDFFEVWFEKHFLAELSEDNVIILDNAFLYFLHIK